MQFGAGSRPGLGSSKLHPRNPPNQHNHTQGTARPPRGRREKRPRDDRHRMRAKTGHFSRDFRKFAPPPLPPSDSRISPRHTPGITTFHLKTKPPITPSTITPGRRTGGNNVGVGDELVHAVRAVLLHPRQRVVGRNRGRRRIHVSQVRHRHEIER